MTTNKYIRPMKFYYNTSLPFLNNPKDPDPSYETDLDFLDCFGRKKKLCLTTEEILSVITEEIQYVWTGNPQHG